MSLIIPNWHPILVHFTIGLFSAAVGFYSLAYLSSKLQYAITNELEVASRWCLWAAALVTVLTIMAGMYAYGTVTHDAPSLNAMNDHSNWALPTGCLILLTGLWSWRRYATRKTLSFLFLITLLLVQLLLVSTAWHGGELVYRYGLGVKALPQVPDKNL